MEAGDYIYPWLQTSDAIYQATIVPYNTTLKIPYYIRFQIYFYN